MAVTYEDSATAVRARALRATHTISRGLRALTGRSTRPSPPSPPPPPTRRSARRAAARTWEDRWCSWARTAARRPGSRAARRCRCRRQRWAGRRGAVAGRRWIAEFLGSPRRRRPAALLREGGRQLQRRDRRSLVSVRLALRHRAAELAQVELHLLQREAEGGKGALELIDDELAAGDEQREREDVVVQLRRHRRTPHTLTHGTRAATVCGSL